jgi:hypothetical protein
MSVLRDDIELIYDALNYQTWDTTSFGRMRMLSVRAAITRVKYAMERAGLLGDKPVFVDPSMT